MLCLSGKGCSVGLVKIVLVVYIVAAALSVKIALAMLPDWQ